MHIGRSIDRLLDLAVWLSTQDDGHVTLLGPYIGRSLLELSLTALVGRLDPFRLLVVRAMQRQQDYEIRSLTRSAVHWQGDMVDNKAVKDPWSPQREFSEVSRSLLGDYYDHLLWRSVFPLLLDATGTKSGGMWLDELRLVEPEHVTAQMRSGATRTYSALSKGLHHEFVIPPETLYDRNTVVTLVNDVLRIASHLGLVSHMIRHCPFCLDIDTALHHYNDVQNSEVIDGH